MVAQGDRGKRCHAYITRPSAQNACPVKLERFERAYFRLFGVQISLSVDNEWIAVDGKTLRGTLKSGEKQAIVHAVSHDSRIDLAQARMVGEKSSEITVVRDFLKDTGLEKKKITRDAHHCNPETTAQIEQSNGRYIV